MTPHSHIITDRPRVAHDLPHFPFHSFNELHRAYDERILDIEVDPGTALHWSDRHRIYDRLWHRIGTAVLVIIPYMVGAALIVLAIQFQWWALVIGLPVIVFGHLVFHPGGKMTHKVIRDITAVATFVALLLGLIGTWWLLVIIAGAMVIVGYARWLVYRHAINQLKRAVLNHEDLFCALWINYIIKIKFYNGTTYSVEGEKYEAPLEQEIT